MKLSATTHAADETHALGAPRRRGAARRRRRGARRRARHRQDRVRQGHRDRARRQRAGREPDVHPRARVRRPDAARARRRVPARPPAGAARPRVRRPRRRATRSPSSSGATGSSALLPADRLEVHLGARRRRRRAIGVGSRPRASRGPGAADSLVAAVVGTTDVLVLAIDTATAQVSRRRSATSGAVLGEVRLAGRPPPRRAARARDRVPVPRARRRAGPPRRDRGRHRSRAVHRAAGRRHHRQGDGPGAAHPGGRRPEPRPRRLPAASQRPDDRRGARRPPPRGVRARGTGPCPAACSACPTTRCTRPPSSSPTSRPSRRAARVAPRRRRRRRASRTSSRALEHAELAGREFAAPSVAALVELATARAEREEFEPPGELRPLYLRQSDAEIAWERPGGGGVSRDRWPPNPTSRR